jgi:hypothetical protein
LLYNNCGALKLLLVIVIILVIAAAAEALWLCGCGGGGGILLLKSKKMRAAAALSFFSAGRSGPCVAVFSWRAAEKKKTAQILDKRRFVDLLRRKTMKDGAVITSRRSGGSTGSSGSVGMRTFPRGCRCRCRAFCFLPYGSCFQNLQAGT